MTKATPIMLAALALTASLVLVMPSGSAQSSLGEAKYLAIAHEASPFVSIYERDVDTLTKLADPAALPTGNGRGVAWSPNSTFLAVAHATSPFVTVYERSGATFTKLANPATLPTGEGHGVAFNATGELLAVAHAVSPFVTIYEWDGSAFVKLPNPASLPAGTSRAVGFSPDGNYMAVGGPTAPRLTIYKWDGASFTKLSQPDVQPTAEVRDIEWAPNGAFLAIADGVISGTARVYSQAGDAFTQVANLDAGDQERSVAWSHDSNRLAVGFFGIKFYFRSGNTFTEGPPLDNEPTSSSTLGLSWSGARGFLGVASAADNRVYLYEWTGEQLSFLDSPPAPPGFAFGAAWNPDLGPGPAFPAAGVEDFENQTTGLAPRAAWYTFGRYGTQCTTTTPPSGFEAKVEEPGSPPTSKSLRLERTGDVIARACFTIQDTLDICEAGRVQFDFKWDADPGARSLGWLWGEGVGITTDLSVGIVVLAGNDVQFWLAPFGTEAVAPSPGGHAETIFTGTTDTWYTAIVEIDCLRGVYSGQVVGQGEVTFEDESIEGAEFNSFRISIGGGSSAVDQWGDEIEITLTSNLPPAPAPSEFDKGLQDFAAGVGFKTPESQFLFALILIGVTTVVMGSATRLIAPGRVKNLLAAGAVALVGAFCVILLFIKLWTFTVALVLGIFIVQGSQAARNTLTDIKRDAAAFFTGAGGKGPKTGGTRTPQDEAAADFVGPPKPTMTAEFVGPPQPEPSPSGFVGPPKPAGDGDAA